MEIEGVYLFTTAILNQLHRDTELPSNCETINEHPVKMCAHMILEDISEFRKEGHVDMVDIASEILRLHTWPI